MSLIDASRDGDLFRVRQLLSASANPNIANRNGHTPLYWASHQGHLEVVKELLSAPGNGVDPNIANKDCKTPLYWASRRGHLEVVRELLFAGADPNIANENGETPLFWASRNQHLEVVKELENYFASLFTLSLISLRKFEIGVSSIPKNLL